MLLAPSLRLPAVHGRDVGDIGPAGATLDLYDPDDFVSHCFFNSTKSMYVAELSFLSGLALQ